MPTSAIAALIVLFRPRLVVRLCEFALIPNAGQPRNLGLALACNTTAFIGIMASAAVLGLSILPAQVGVTSTAALYIVAWLIGFAMPGAPGGLGVREAFMVMQLAPAAGEPEALAFALMTRLVSIAGDMLFVFAGVVLKAWLPVQPDSD